MLKHLKTRVVWLTVGLVLGGGALSYAGVTSQSSHGPTPKPSVSAKASDDANEPADNESDQNKSDSNEQRPLNHGFYVSQAAQCKNVDDATNNVTFSAPADCATNGQAHGGYVSQVAQSDAGKTDHSNGHANSQNKTK